MISTRPLKDGLGKELGFYVELGGLKVFVLGFFMWHIRLEVVKDRMLPRISGSGECSLGSLSAPHIHSLSLWGRRMTGRRKISARLGHGCGMWLASGDSIVRWDFEYYDV